MAAFTLESVKTTSLFAVVALAAIATLTASLRADAQQPPPDTTKPATARPDSASQLEFSGVLYTNFQYRVDRGPSKSQNKFELERAYLTFRMKAGERASVRVTADVFQQSAAPNDAFYKGWVVRAKYAYLQYDLLKGARWNANIRAGLLHNVVIDHIESFWPRWIALSSIERVGFFSSSDAGVATLWTFPRGFGEFYATIVNGPGYTSRESDRFKDYAARLSVTPLAGSNSRIVRTFALTGWTYVGAMGSTFASGGTGQLGPVGSSVPRTRAGLFAGIRDPRLSGGLEWDVRHDGGETGANTAASPRAEIDSSGRLISVFASIKPFLLRKSDSRFPLGLVGRWDRFTPRTDLDGYVTSVVAGITWDLNKKTAISIDYQEHTPHSAAIAPSAKTYFFHLVAGF